MPFHRSSLPAPAHAGTTPFGSILAGETRPSGLPDRRADPFPQFVERVQILEPRRMLIPPDDDIGPDAGIAVEETGWNYIHLAIPAELGNEAPTVAAKRAAEAGIVDLVREDLNEFLAGKPSQVLLRQAEVGDMGTTTGLLARPAVAVSKSQGTAPDFETNPATQAGPLGNIQVRHQSISGTAAQECQYERFPKLELACAR